MIIANMAVQHQKVIRHWKDSRGRKEGAHPLTEGKRKKNNRSGQGWMKEGRMEGRKDGRE